MTVLRVDLETFSSVDITKAGAYAYVDSDDFEILLFGYAFDDDPVTVIDLASGERIPYPVMGAISDPTIIKKAYNANFERLCLSKYYGKHLNRAQWRCTAVAASYLGLPGTLDGVAKELKLTEGKDPKGKALIKYFSMPCKPTKVNGGQTRNMPSDNPEKWAEYIEYCRQDVIVEREIDKKVSRFPVPESEWDLWILDQKINDRGVRIDPLLVANAIECDAEDKVLLKEEMTRITGVANPNSDAQIKGWFAAQGIEGVNSLTKESIPLLLERGLTPLARRVLELRVLLNKTSVRKYDAMQRSLCKDWRVHGMLKFYGANRTGRWAGRIVQLQNLPRNDIKDLDLARDMLRSGEYDMIDMLYGSRSHLLSQLIRTALMPSTGNRFIVSDFSAIEARVLAWLAGEEWVLDVFRTHGKIYEASASQMFNVPLEKIKKGNPEYELRAKGKVAVLALGYNGGPKALEAMGALKQGLKEEELQPIVDKYRAANPKIVQFWKDIESAAIRSMQNQTTVPLQHGMAFIWESGILFFRLPSGRRLAYFKPRLEEGNFGKQQLSYDGITDKGIWGTVRTYGGKLTENITQAVARDCLAESMIRLDAAGYDIAFHVHDEVVADMPVGRGSVEEMAEIMGNPISWCKDLPLGAEGYECEFYKKD